MKIKHLEFIEDIISRLNNNSFFIKGWLITLMAGLYALYNELDTNFFLFTFFIIFIFWGLDCFYLLKEKKYICLYDEIRAKKEEDINFSLDIKHINIGTDDVISIAFSPSLALFYSPLLILNFISFIIWRN